MFDTSYNHLLQISCQDPAHLTASLNRLTDSRTGRIFSLPEEGDHQHSEHQVILFEPPVAVDNHRRCLGELSYLWIPETNSDSRRLWLWIHPAFAEAVLPQLKAAMGLASDVATDAATAIATDTTAVPTASSTVSQDADEDSGGPKPKKARVEKDPNYVHATKLAARNVPSLTKAPRSVTSADSNRSLELVVLTGTVNRLRLVGPLSAALLQAVCRPAVVATNAPEASSNGDSSSTVSDQRCWWTRFYAEQQAKAQQAAQSLQLAALPVVGSAAAAELMSCTVRDPRILLPVKRPVKISVASQEKRKEVADNPTSPSGSFLFSAFLSDSPFFSPEIR